MLLFIYTIFIGYTLKKKLILDIMKKNRDIVYRIIAEGLDPDLTNLEDVMTTNPTTIDINAQAVEALSIMQKLNFRHLPVTENNKLIGIVSRRDFFSIDDL